MRNIYLIAGLLIVSATAATAEEISQHIATISVSSSDLVDGKAGARLQDRIGRAIDNVCGTSADSLEQFVHLSRCRKSARAAIAEQVAKPPLPSMVASRK